MNIKMFSCIKNALRHSMNRTQSKNHRIEKYEIKKTFLSWSDDKTYFCGNGIVALVFSA